VGSAATVDVGVGAAPAVGSTDAELVAATAVDVVVPVCTCEPEHAVSNNATTRARKPT